MHTICFSVFTFSLLFFSKKKLYSALLTAADQFDRPIKYFSYSKINNTRKIGQVYHLEWSALVSKRRYFAY